MNNGVEEEAVLEVLFEPDPLATPALLPWLEGAELLSVKYIDGLVFVLLPDERALD